MANRAGPVSGKAKESDPTPMETVACDHCGSSRNTVVFSCNNFPDDIDGPQNVVRCDECGLLFTSPRPTRDAITRLYQKYYMSTNHSENAAGRRLFTRRRPVLRRLWHLYCGQYLGYVLKKARGRVLDIGCGTGGLLEELADTGCEPFGVELNPDSVDICRKKGLDVRCGDLDDFAFENDYFDAVVLWHVIEHVPSPATTLGKIRRILKPGGSVFAFAPNAASYMSDLFGKQWFPWQVPFHFYHFTTSSFRALAEKSSFTISRLAAVTPEYYLPYSFDIWNKSLRKKKKSAAIVALMHSFIFRIMIAAVFRVLDIVFHGRGECLQIELKKPLS